MLWSSSLLTWGMEWEARPQTTTWNVTTLVSSFRDKYAVEFQFVDMRWGVRDKTTDDHMNTWQLVSYFRDKYAVEFQFVDMRWGVRTRPKLITWTYDHCILFQFRGVPVCGHEVGVQDEIKDDHMISWPLYPLSGTNTQWSSSLWTWGGGWGTRPQTTTWQQASVSRHIVTASHHTIKI